MPLRKQTACFSNFYCVCMQASWRNKHCSQFCMMQGGILYEPCNKGNTPAGACRALIESGILKRIALRRAKIERNMMENASCIFKHFHLLHSVLVSYFCPPRAVKILISSDTFPSNFNSTSNRVLITILIKIWNYINKP